MVTNSHDGQEFEVFTAFFCDSGTNDLQAVVRKNNKPRPRVAHRGIARFLRIDPKSNKVVPWSLRTFLENFMQIGPAVFS